MATFAEHDVGLVFICELAECHQERATLPLGWQKVGAGEFQLLLAAGWSVGDYSLRRVWPNVRADHSRSGWRVYLQVALAIVAAAMAVVVLVVLPAAAQQ